MTYYFYQSEFEKIDIYTKLELENLKLEKLELGLIS